MNRTLPLTLLFLSFLSYSSFSQDYSYTHYDIQEGLAGSTVYCITQDQDGFIWAGTETGVSRFDGTHFRNFTTIDGLPDIEILQIFGDSKGRVWMAPFHRSVCYYYKGLIHNAGNDPLIRRIRIRRNIESFAEDAHGNILMQERTSLHLLLATDSLVEYDSIRKEPIRECVPVSKSSTGDFLVQVNRGIYAFSAAGNAFTLLFPIELYKDVLPNYIAINPHLCVYRSASNTIIRSLAKGKIACHNFENDHYRHINYSITGDSLVYLDESSGVTEYNVNTGAIQKFLPNIEVSRTFRDQAGNSWFTTLGQGIYRLNSSVFRNKILHVPHVGDCSVYSINGIGRHLFVGTNHNFVFTYPRHDLSIKPGGSRWLLKNRNLYIYGFGQNGLLIGSDYGMMMYRPAFPAFHYLSRFPGGIKYLFKKSEDEFIFCASWGAGILNVKDLRIKDTLWRERTSAVYYRNDTIWLATMNGLYQLTKDGSAINLGNKIPFLQKRVSAIAASADGTLWIASYEDAGVIGYKDGRVIATLTSREGLTSDICKALLIHGNNLWVGTDKGLNRIDLTRQGYPVTRYTANDGLGADMINTLYADSTMIYAGTPAGLTFFDETKAIPTDECRLSLLAVINSGKSRIADTADLILPYTEKDIRFEFAGVSYRSNGNLIYRYRLMGLDSSWSQTRETFLEYPVLPSGKYELQLQATNEFGVKSPLLSQRFTVTAPFWKTIWFEALLVFAFLALTWLIVSWRIKRIRSRQEEKDIFKNRLVEMEQLALRAQMNPHFIFNCLNSIQQYIFDQDVLAANKYLTGFARLIRSTLHNSLQAYINLDGEIDYLTNYLSLEKIRFKDKMEYTIYADPALDKKNSWIPPMIIQPFIENSIRHGIRHKKDGNGYLKVEMLAVDSKLKILIEDNGIGRENASSYKTDEHIEYQSRGMSLTADRIRLINTVHGDGITIEITDLCDDQGFASGTRVLIVFPRFDNPTHDNPTPSK